MALDHVGIALADRARARLEEFRLIATVAADDVAVPGRVRERHGDDPVARPGRARKLVPVRRQDLDVQGEAAEVREGEAPERGPAGEEQVLVDRVGEETVRRVGRAGGPGAPLAAEIARREAVAPRGEACDPPEIPGARELGEREEARSPVEERPVGGEEKRGERLLLDRGALPAAAVEP